MKSTPRPRCTYVIEQGVNAGKTCVRPSGHTGAHHGVVSTRRELYKAGPKLTEDAEGAGLEIEQITHGRVALALAQKFFASDHHARARDLLGATPSEIRYKTRERKK